jgi:hypothetical protein
VRIGSAESSLTVYDKWNRKWVECDDGQLNYVPTETVIDGFVLLVECKWCPAERGYGEYAGKTEKRTAAYARAFIEKSPTGILRKGD